MVEVTLEYLGYIRECVGMAQETMRIEDGSTLADLVRLWQERYCLEEPYDSPIIILNGKSIAALPRRWETPLATGDRVMFINQISGG